MFLSFFSEAEKDLGALVPLWRGVSCDEGTVGLVFSSQYCELALLFEARVVCIPDVLIRKTSWKSFCFVWQT